MVNPIKSSPVQKPDSQPLKSAEGGGAKSTPGEQKSVGTTTPKVRTDLQPPLSSVAHTGGSLKIASTADSQQIAPRYNGVYDDSDSDSDFEISNLLINNPDRMQSMVLHLTM